MYVLPFVLEGFSLVSISGVGENFEDRRKSKTAGGPGRYLFNTRYL